MISRSLAVITAFAAMIPLSGFAEVRVDEGGTALPAESAAASLSPTTGSPWAPAFVALLVTKGTSDPMWGSVHALRNLATPESARNLERFPAPLARLAAPLAELAGTPVAFAALPESRRKAVLIQAARAAERTARAQARSYLSQALPELERLDALSERDEHRARDIESNLEAIVEFDLPYLDAASARKVRAAAGAVERLWDLRRRAQEEWLRGVHQRVASGNFDVPALIRTDKGWVDLDRSPTATDESLDDIVRRKIEVLRKMTDGPIKKAEAERLFNAVAPVDTPEARQLASDLRRMLWETQIQSREHLESMAPSLRALNRSRAAATKTRPPAERHIRKIARYYDALLDGLPSESALGERTAYWRTAHLFKQGYDRWPPVQALLDGARALQERSKRRAYGLVLLALGEALALIGLLIAALWTPIALVAGGTAAILVVTLLAGRLTENAISSARRLEEGLERSRVAGAITALENEISAQSPPHG